MSGVGVSPTPQSFIILVEPPSSRPHSGWPLCSRAGDTGCSAKKKEIRLVSNMASQLSDSSMAVPAKVLSVINKKVNGKISAKKGAAGLLAPIAVRASKPIQIPPLDNPLLKIPDKD